MNEQQLTMLTNLVVNPYTWVLFGFMMALPYMLKFMRRFYPKRWQEAMAKEDVCTLEQQQKPEMKLAGNVMTIGILSAILLSYIVTFHLLIDLVNPLATFLNIFTVGAMLVLATAVYIERKIKKNKNCKNAIAGYKFIKITGKIGIAMLAILFVIAGLREWKII